MPYVETKKLKFFIDGKSFFELPVKTREEVYEKKTIVVKDYTTGNLLDYNYFSNNYKLTAIDLSEQIELEDLDLKNKLILLKNLKWKKI